MRIVPFLRIAVVGLVSVTGCTRKTEKQDTKTLLLRAEPLCAAEQFRRCAELLTIGARSQPDDPEIHYRLGLALRDSHEIEGAKDELYWSHKLEPDYKDSLLRLAELMVKSSAIQDVQWSAEHANRVLAKKKDAASQADAYFVLGVGKLRLRLTDDAIADFQKALEAEPSHAASAINLAVLEWMNGSPARADAVIRKVAAVSKQPVAWAAAGEFLRLEGKNADAESEFRRVLGNEPANETALLNLGGILMASGRMAEAEQVYARAARLPNGRYLHAAFQYQTGKTDEAVVELQALVAEDPSNNQVKRCLEALLLATRQYRESLALADQVLAKHVCNAPARLLVGEAWLGLQNINESAAAMDEAVRCNARSAATRFLTARVLAVQNKRALSNSELREVLRLEPGFIAAHIALIRSHIAEGQLQIALDEIEEEGLQSEKAVNAARLFPARRKVQLEERGGIWAAERNWVLLAGGDYTRALAFLEADLVSSRNVELLLQRAVAGFGAGKAEANVFLDEALRLNPASRAALHAREIFQTKPPAARWAKLATSLADDVRPAVSGVELLELPGSVVRSAFVLREPYPNL